MAALTRQEPAKGAPSAIRDMVVWHTRPAAGPCLSQLTQVLSPRQRDFLHDLFEEVYHRFGLPCVARLEVEGAAREEPRHVRCGPEAGAGMNGEHPARGLSDGAVRWQVAEPAGHGPRHSDEDVERRRAWEGLELPPARRQDGLPRVVPSGQACRVKENRCSLPSRPCHAGCHCCFFFHSREPCRTGFRQP